jgi:PAS domain S-box-containing protein
MSKDNFYSSVFSAIPLPAVIINVDAPHFTIIEVNTAYLKLAGKSKDQLIGSRLSEIFPDIPGNPNVDGVKNLTKLLNQVIKTGNESSNKVQRYKVNSNKSGVSEVCYFNQIHTPVKNSEGEVEYIIQVLEEIAEKKLEELSLVASKTTELVIITDSEKRITWVNKAFENKTGYTLEECKGKIPGDFLHGPATDEKTKRRLSNLIQHQVSAEEVILNYAKDGTTFWLEMIIDPIFNEDGECTHFISIERDVTDKIRKEKELLELLERYEIVSKATSDTIWDFDLRKDLMIYNRNIFTMFGYPHTEVQDMAGWWRDKIHPDDREIVNQKIRTVLAYGIERFQMEYRFRASDGSYKHIYDRAFLIKDQFGEPVRMIGAMQDVTQKVKEQEQLRLMDSVITNTNEAVMIVEAEPTDLDGRKILYVNDAFSRIMGYTKEEVTGYTLDVLNMHQTNQNEWTKMLKEMETSHSAEAEFVNVNKEGEEYWVYASIEWVGGSNGDQDYWVFIGRDITENKRQENKLRSSLQEKVILLSEIHHRVKNNLAVVSSLMEIQAMKSSNPELSSQLLDSVLRIKSMATIHEQLYQSENFSEIQFSEGIKKLIEDIIKTLNSTVDIDLIFNLEEIPLSITQGVPCSLIINEVVTNILKHAYSGRESGIINTTVEQENDDIKLQICDDGNGLPENFGEMKDESLGLQLIDLLTIQLGGEKVFTSSGSGACFTLTFPKINAKDIGSDFAHKGDPFY